jgi:hypothetical protein
VIGIKPVACRIRSILKILHSSLFPVLIQRKSAYRRIEIKDAPALARDEKNSFKGEIVL